MILGLWDGALSAVPTNVASAFCYRSAGPGHGTHIWLRTIAALSAFGRPRITQSLFSAWAHHANQDVSSGLPSPRHAFPLSLHLSLSLSLSLSPSPLSPVMTGKVPSFLPHCLTLPVWEQFRWVLIFCAPYCHLLDEELRPTCAEPFSADWLPWGLVSVKCWPAALWFTVRCASYPVCVWVSSDGRKGNTGTVRDQNESDRKDITEEGLSARD